MKKLLCFLALLLTLTLNGSEWSLQEVTKGWSSRELVTLYFHNSELQTQWAWQTLSHYRFKRQFDVRHSENGPYCR